MIQTENRRNAYIGDGTTAVYDYTFRIMDKTHILVLADGVPLDVDSDYTVAGVDDESGGTVTITKSALLTSGFLTTGVVLTLLYGLPAVQLDNYEEGSVFPAEMHERALDYLTMLVLKLLEILNRVPQLPPESTADPIALPEPVEGKTLVWQDGDLVNADLGTGDVTGAPADVDYLVKTASGNLSAERVVTNTTSITWDFATASQAKAKRAALTGDVTASSDSNATTIANDAVTYAKMQNVSAASKLLGRGSAAGSGDPQEITIGTALSMSGTTLSATGTVSGLTTGKLPKAASATSLSDSLLSESGSTVTVTGSFNSSALTASRPVLTDGSKNLVSGSAGFSGTVSNPTSITVVNGIVTACS
jgi:hypothetical protein